MGKLLALVTLLCITIQLSHCSSSKKKSCYDGSDIMWQATGKDSVTKSGRTCQRWDTNYPHNITGRWGSLHTHFPEKKVKDAKNYCRTPDTKKVPWCYTTDPKKPTETCDMPLCKGLEKCYFREVPTYKGSKSKAESGNECLRWDSAEVKKIAGRLVRYFTPFPDKSLSDSSNFCRQPFVWNMTLGEKPWCYTGKGRSKYEYCNIELCPEKCSPILKNTYIATWDRERKFFGKGKKRKQYLLKDTEAECIKACKNTSGCYRWTYIPANYPNKKYQKQCYMMAVARYSMRYKGISSGSVNVC